MATYIVGDIQGCFDSLRLLLQKIDFGPTDQLWSVGDLVNRGPDSLSVLRYFRDLGSRGRVVLGNHDLHLLGVWAGVRSQRTGDTLNQVLEAADADELCQWLSEQPLFFNEGLLTLVHAGLSPHWSLDDLAAAGTRVQEVLRKADMGALWKDGPGHTEELGRDVEYLTRVRMVDSKGVPVPEHKGPPDEAEPGLCPWFEHPAFGFPGRQIVFGHWAALGHRRGDGWLSLDSGCVWGGGLTAWCPDDDRVVFQPAAESQ